MNNGTPANKRSDHRIFRACDSSVKSVVYTSVNAKSREDLMVTRPPHFVRSNDAVDDAPSVLTAISCAAYKDLKTRFDSAQKRFAQYCDQKHRDLAGEYSERARNVQREAKANMTLFGQRIFDHKVGCLVCTSETANPPSKVEIRARATD